MIRVLIVERDDVKRSGVNATVATIFRKINSLGHPKGWLFSVRSGTDAINVMAVKKIDYLVIPLIPGVYSLRKIRYKTSQWQLRVNRVRTHPLEDPLCAVPSQRQFTDPVERIERKSILIHGEEIKWSEIENLLWRLDAQIIKQSGFHPAKTQILLLNLSRSQLLFLQNEKILEALVAKKQMHRKKRG